MNTKLLSDSSLKVVDQYLHFTVASAVCTVPYYNNRHIKGRAKLAVHIGKGSSKEILEEVENITALEKIDATKLDGVTLKRLLVDNNIGIDCSGFAYYILNAESEARGKGSLDKHLTFPFSPGLLGAFRAKFRPIQNAGVVTFAHEDNSQKVEIKDAQPGDIITMTGGEAGREHIVVIHKIEYENFIPKVLHYTHSIAWPTDGEYDHGVRQGRIEMLDAHKPITEQKWIEKSEDGDSENYTHTRAQKSTTNLRRLRFLC